MIDYGWPAYLLLVSWNHMIVFKLFVLESN